MKEIIDMKPLDAEQMKTVHQLMTMSQKFCDDMKQLMIHSHLWHKGFTLKLQVSPSMDLFTEDIQFYRRVEDGDGLYDEEIERMKGSGEYDNGWETYPVCTSREFIHLFDEKKDATGTEAGEEVKDTVPVDNLCAAVDGCSSALDGRNEVNTHESVGSV